MTGPDHQGRQKSKDQETAHDQSVILRLQNDVQDGVEKGDAGTEQNAEPATAQNGAEIAGQQRCAGCGRRAIGPPEPDVAGRLVRD